MSDPSKTRHSSIELLFALVLVVILHVIVLGPLHGEAAEMHAAQLDPTEIVVVPYRLAPLSTHTVLVGSITLIWTHSCNLIEMWKRIQDLSLASVFIFLFMLVSGAFPSKPLAQTALGAIQVSLLLLLGLSREEAMHKSQSSSALLLSLLHRSPPIARKQHRPYCLSPHFVLLGTLLCQILLLYDRGWQVQRWPVPVILGATYGYAIGCLAECIMLLPQTAKYTRSRG